MGAFLYFFFGWYKLRTTPPTNEPPIGNYQIHLMGQGVILNGITTTATHQVDDTYLNALAEKNEEAGKLREIFRKLHLYGIRNGTEKVLILSTRSIETQEYADSPETGTEYQFPFGYIAQRQVYGKGVIVHRSKLPTLFEFFDPDWDGVVFLRPRNNKTDRFDDDFETFKELQALGELSVIIQNAAQNTKELEAVSNVKTLLQDRLDEAYDRLAEQVDKANLANQQAHLSSPFAGEQTHPEPPSEGFLNLTRGRLMLMAIGGYIGHLKLPDYINVKPGVPAFALGAAAIYLVIAILEGEIL